MEIGTSEMDRGRIVALISLLRDPSARIDERDDAAIDLAQVDDPQAMAALVEIGSERSENETILATCGEALGLIAVRLGRLDAGWTERLAPAAAAELIATVKAERSDLLGP